MESNRPGWTRKKGRKGFQRERNRGFRSLWATARNGDALEGTPKPRLNFKYFWLGLDPPQLYIRKAKFYKSRIVPIHYSTADQLRVYLQERNLVKLRRPSKAFFITGRRLPLCYAALRRMFRQLVQSVGIKNVGGKRGPLLH